MTVPADSEMGIMPPSVRPGSAAAGSAGRARARCASLRRRYSRPARSTPAPRAVARTHGVTSVRSRDVHAATADRCVRAPHRAGGGPCRPRFGTPIIRAISGSNNPSRSRRSRRSGRWPASFRPRAAGRCRAPWRLSWLARRSRAGSSAGLRDDVWRWPIQHAIRRGRWRSWVVPTRPLLAAGASDVTPCARHSAGNRRGASRARVTSAG